MGFRRGFSGQPSSESGILAYASRPDAFGTFPTDNTWGTGQDSGHLVSIQSQFTLLEKSLVRLEVDIPTVTLNTAGARVTAGIELRSGPSFNDPRIKAATREGAAAHNASQTTQLKSVKGTQDLVLAAGDYQIKLQGNQQSQAGGAVNATMTFFGSITGLAGQGAFDFPTTMSIRATLLKGRGAPGRRSRVRYAAYAAGEGHTSITPELWLPGEAGNKPPIIFMTGRGAYHDQATAAPYVVHVINKLVDAGWPVMAIDAGGTSLWANDTVMTAITAAIAYAQDATKDIGAGAGDVILGGVSMGALDALAYTVLNQANVRGVFGMIPAVDIRRHHSNDTPAGAKAEIEAAYGTGVVANVNGVAAITNRNPFTNAAALDVPIGLWRSSNDPSCPTAWTDEFGVAVGSNCEVHNIGAVGHVPNATPANDVLSFVSQL